MTNAVASPLGDAPPPDWGTVELLQMPFRIMAWVMLLFAGLYAFNGETRGVIGSVAFAGVFAGAAAVVGAWPRRPGKGWRWRVRFEAAAALVFAMVITVAGLVGYFAGWSFLDTQAFMFLLGGAVSVERLVRRRRRLRRSGAVAA